MGVDETRTGAPAAPRRARRHLTDGMRSAIALAVLAIALPRAAAAEPPAAEPSVTEPPAAEEAAAGAVPAEPEVVGDVVADDYDPWQPFNERMFTFNHDVLDRYVLKPAATGWNWALPDVAQRCLGRAFDNLNMPRRVVNHLLQLHPRPAGGEAARFVINTTAGVVGLFDVAELVHLEKCDADMGQTLGKYGVGPGPYLVLPLLPPLTVRDGIGRGIDGAMDPFGFFIPFVASTAMNVVNTVNERSLNLKLFADVEESVLDLYSAVRNGYLQHRRNFVEEARGGGTPSSNAVAGAAEAPAPDDPS